MAESKGKTSVKHLQMDKDQSTMLAVIAAAVVITIFCLFAAKALVSKGLYQRRALSSKNQVVDQLKKNEQAAQTLFTQYKVFADQQTNVLGGSSDGSGNLDGDNPRIVLDSLPSTYDAPALAASIEKVMSGRGVSINSLTVTDDPTTYPDDPQSTPKVTSVTFSFEGTSDYARSQQLLQDFERSIRPFDLNTLEIDGTDNNLKLTVGMTTYYQAARSLDLKPTKEVK